MSEVLDAPVSKGDSQVEDTMSMEEEEESGSYMDSEEEYEDMYMYEESGSNTSGPLDDGKNKSEKDVLRTKKEQLKADELQLKRDKKNYRKSKKVLKKQTKQEFRTEKSEYRKQKKETRLRSVNASEHLHSGWLKYRGSLKNWYKRWFVVKPGIMLYYNKEPTDEKEKNAHGVLILSGCAIMERPSKKEGYGFKVFHPHQQNIWSKGDVFGNKTHHIILLAGAEEERDVWMSALATAAAANVTGDQEYLDGTFDEDDSPIKRRNSWRLSNEGVLGGDSSSEVVEDASVEVVARSVSPETVRRKKRPDSGVMSLRKKVITNTNKAASGAISIPVATQYTREEKINDNADSDSNEEELGGESKNILLILLKQVKPGMDLAKVVLPTFILEPRSMLEKCTDFLTHAELLSKVPTYEDPKWRIMAVVKWYLSGFYIKPQGVKKPYNPIIGETFRCSWNHHSGSTTYFFSEQVSHHPPVSAFYAVNRKDGFIINGSILFKSKFTGTAAQSILDGTATIYFPQHNEEYEITFPTAAVKGIFFGTMTMELIGKVTITCPKTDYSAKLEFKPKPFFGGEYNCISGKISVGSTEAYTITGKWDGIIELKDSSTKETTVMWEPTAKIRETRMPKQKIPLDQLHDFESERLWMKVSEAIATGDQVGATDEKAVLEQRQREEAKQREADGVEWETKWFKKENDKWMYNWLDKTVYNEESEGEIFEANGRIWSSSLAEQLEQQSTNNNNNSNDSNSGSHGPRTSPIPIEGSSDREEDLDSSGELEVAQNSNSSSSEVIRSNSVPPASAVNPSTMSSMKKRRSASLSRTKKSLSPPSLSGSSPSSGGMIAPQPVASSTHTPPGGARRNPQKLKIDEAMDKRMVPLQDNLANVKKDVTTDIELLEKRISKLSEAIEKKKKNKVELPVFLIWALLVIVAILVYRMIDLEARVEELKTSSFSPADAQE